MFYDGPGVRNPLIAAFGLWVIFLILGESSSAELVELPARSKLLPCACRARHLRCASALAVLLDLS